MLRQREEGRGPAPRGSRRAARGPERVYLIHRLDRPASGLLLFAKTEPAREALKDLLASRKIARRYIAVVRGRPGEAEGEFRSRLVELEGPRHRVRSLRRGDPPARRAKAREAVTRYRVLGSRRGLSALELTLETGRKHQIRVHLAEAGHPVLGDRLYSGPARRGKAGREEARLHLHAWRLAFTHPVTRKRIEIVSPPGPEFQRAVPGAFGRIG
jgi:RluA family pseudouridine synthase